MPTNSAVPRNFKIRNSEPRLTQFQQLQNQKMELRKKQLEQKDQLIKILQSPGLDNATKEHIANQLENLLKSIKKSINEDSMITQQTTPPTEKKKETLKQQLDNELDEISESKEPDSDSSVAHMEDKLASLKEKADQLLTNPPSFPQRPPPFYASRGRGSRGRGMFPPRGGFRGRGRGISPYYPPPRGGRGAYSSVNRRPMSIDNRTCTIMIEDPPSSLLDDGPLSELFQVFIIFKIIKYNN